MRGGYAGEGEDGQGAREERVEVRVFLLVGDARGGGGARAGRFVRCG